MNKLQQGFTLVEVLVAISISAILLVTIYGVFTSMSRARARLQTEGEGYHLARVIFDRIGREIRGSYVAGQAPETRLRGGIDDRGVPFLTLATTASTPRQGVTSGIALVRYELRETAGEPAGRMALMRSERPYFTEDTQAPAYRLASGIDSLRVRFLSGGEWRDQWPPDTGDDPPQAVEVTLTLAVDGTSIPFRSAFEVPAIGAD